MSGEIDGALRLSLTPPSPSQRPGSILSKHLFKPCSRSYSNKRQKRIWFYHSGVLVYQPPLNTHLSQWTSTGTPLLPTPLHRIGAIQKLCDLGFSLEGFPGWSSLDCETPPPTWNSIERRVDAIRKLFEVYFEGFELGWVGPGPWLDKGGNFVFLHILIAFSVEVIWS